MQTFMTHMKHGKTAEALDMMRLGKVRDSARRILEILLGDDDGSVTDNPAVEMWRGYEPGLVYYGLCISYNWSVGRGLPDSTLRYFKDKADELAKQGLWTDFHQSPPWLKDVWLLRSHRSNLIRKMPHHYGPLFPSTPENMPFLWPVNDDLGGYQLRVSVADLERIERGERKLPTELRIDGEWVTVDE